jgi:Ni/Co efflux regulator RcnB
MQKLLSIIVATAFAAASFGVAAQSKDVTTKGGEAVPSKGGPNVTSKDMKEKPKAAPKPKKEPKPAKAKAKTPTSNVTTKEKKPVTDKGQQGVTTK